MGASQRSSARIINDISFNIDQDDYVMFIHYSMTPVNSDDTYKLTVFISEDNGRTWFSPKSLKGDIGLQKGYGRRVIEWDIFADVDDLEGEVKVKIKAKVYKSTSDKISELLFNLSEEKKENENGLYFYFNYPNFTFNNSVFKNKIDDGTFTRNSAGGFAFEYKSIPHVYATEVNMVSFDYSLDEDDIVLFTFDLNYRYSFFSIKNLASSIGIGYQASDISIYNDEITDWSDLNTSGFYLMGDIRFGFVTDKNFTIFGKGWTPSPRNGIGIGTSLKRSINLGERDWEQSNIYLYLFGDWALIPCALVIGIVGAAGGM